MPMSWPDAPGVQGIASECLLDSHRSARRLTRAAPHLVPARSWRSLHTAAYKIAADDLLDAHKVRYPVHHSRRRAIHYDKRITLCSSIQSGRQRRSADIFTSSLFRADGRSRRVGRRAVTEVATMKATCCTPLEDVPLNGHRPRDSRARALLTIPALWKKPKASGTLTPRKAASPCWPHRSPIEWR